MRAAVVTCYRHPDYVRAITLREALRDSGVAVQVVRNRSTGVRRYLEVAQQLWRLRADRPDLYVVTFRAYEILPVVLALAGRRPVVYDEFIPPIEWFVEEHGRLRPGSIGARMLRAAFRALMRRSARILADTASHADHGADLMGIERDRYAVVPVGTDEVTFSVSPQSPPGTLRVLYYGSMLPLHGLDVVLEAAVALRDADVEIVLVGGDEETERQVAAVTARGARVTWTRWVPYAELPALIASCHVVVGGPLGGTVQSQFVVTGKTFQSMAASMPTIVGRNRETGALRDQHDALLVDQADPEAFAQTCRWALTHRDELPAIGARGRETYERLWSAPRIADAVGAVVDDLVGRGLVVGARGVGRDGRREHRP